MNLLRALTVGGAPQPVLAFAEDEYRWRLDAVRAWMAADGIEVLLVTDAANLCYLAGYETVLSACYAVLAVPLEGDVVFHLPESRPPVGAHDGREGYRLAAPLSPTATGGESSSRRPTVSDTR